MCEGVVRRESGPCHVEALMIELIGGEGGRSGHIIRRNTRTLSKIGTRIVEAGRQRKIGCSNCRLQSQDLLFELVPLASEIGFGFPEAHNLVFERFDVVLRTLTMSTMKRQNRMLPSGQ